MYYILGGILALLLGLWIKGRIQGSSALKDTSDLEKKEVQIQSQIDQIKKGIDEPQPNLTPDEVVKFWTKK